LGREKFTVSSIPWSGEIVPLENILIASTIWAVNASGAEAPAVTPIF
jgi:hypothetical protein